MIIKTRKQFERVFNKKTIHLRDSVKLYIRQKIGRLNPLILKNKELVLHNNVAVPIFLIDPTNSVTNFSAINIIGYRINGNLLMSSNTIQRLKHGHLHIHKRNYRLNGTSYFTKRILVCHN